MALLADQSADANSNLVTGTGTSSVQYTVPSNVLIKVESVVATITNGAGAAVTPELTIRDQSGVVIARRAHRQSMPAGDSGTATWALRLDDDAVVAAAGGNFPTLVMALPGLIGYWRLGEAASPFADTSGYSPGSPADLSLIVNGVAATLHDTGALTANDDGALKQNYAGTVASGNAAADWIDDLSIMDRFNFNGTDMSMSCGVWIKPLASGNTWRGGIIGDQALIAGSPNYEGGWSLSMNWPGQTVAFFRGESPTSATTVTSTALTANVWHFVVGTYDETTMRLYVDGTLNASAASAVTPTSRNTITIGQTAPGGSYRGRFYGSLDEAFVTETTLDASTISTLYAAR